jgi:hypothetical protein
MNKRWSVVVLCVCALLLASISPARAGGINEVSPAEGTVGSVLSISGDGFGEKRGEVLIGLEKCRVLDWQDSQITCQVEKAQPAGEYPVTVLPQGQKKSPAPITFTSFAMRAPQIIPAGTPTGLLWDGQAVTVLGDFFGDQKGDIYIVHRAGELLVEQAKVVDWTMKTVRFEIPKKLAPESGTYILAVKNDVGLGYRILELAGGGPPVLGSAPGIGGEPVDSTASAIYFNGKFYVFTVKWACGLICGDSHRIQMRTLTNGQLSSFLSIPNTQTNAAVVPLVVGTKLWVFYTGQSGNVWYNIYDGTSWSKPDGWIQIPGVSTKNTWEVAAVFNPDLHHLVVYYENQGYLKMVYTDNYGTDWINMGNVKGFGAISTPPGAMIYRDGTNFYKVLLAVADTTPALQKAHQGHVYQSYDSYGFSPILNFGPVFGRPFLVDMSADSVGLVYVKDDCTWAPTADYDGDPLIRKMNKATGVWQDPITPLAPSYESWYPPSGAYNLLDGKFYLSWANYDITQDLRVWWLTGLTTVLP